MNTQKLPGAALRQKILDRLPELKTKGICRVPNQRFWDFYREHKDKLHLACIGVQKDETGNWCIVKYPHINREEEAQREIDEMLSRHTNSCWRCRSQIFLIRKNIQSNNVANFQYWCNFCQRTASSALPHKLVEYLVETQNFQIIHSVRSIKEKQQYRYHRKKAADFV